MAAQGALALAVVLVVLLILVGRARAGSPGDDGEDVHALIGKEIDAQIEGLAQSWLDARCGDGTARPGSDRFSQEVELFIAGVLRRAEHAEPSLRDAMRELMVLERDDVRAEIEKRVEAHLRRPWSTEPPALTRARVRV